MKSNYKIQDEICPVVEEAKPVSQDIGTGSLRYNSDKPSAHHIPPKFIIALADLMTESAKKYSRWNYAKGQPFTTPYDSLMRHLHEFMDGEDNDRQSKKSHLLHVAANAMIMWTTQEYRLDKYPELDDRFNKFLEEE
jgi:hypothetical protein